MIFQKGNWWKSSLSPQKFATKKEAQKFEGIEEEEPKPFFSEEVWKYQEETLSPIESFQEETSFESL